MPRAVSPTIAQLIVDSSTLGQAWLTTASQGAIRFPRINANNTLSYLDAASFRTAIGAGTSSFTGAFADLTGKPTTFAGYGIVSSQEMSGIGTLYWSDGNHTLTGGIGGFIFHDTDAFTFTGANVTAPGFVTTGRVNAGTLTASTSAAGITGTNLLTIGSEYEGGVNFLRIRATGSNAIVGGRFVFESVSSDGTSFSGFFWNDGGEGTGWKAIDSWGLGSQSQADGDMICLRPNGNNPREQKVATINNEKLTDHRYATLPNADTKFLISSYHHTLAGPTAARTFTLPDASATLEQQLTFSTGLTRSTNTVTVNASQNISTLSNLTSNGLVTTSGGTGALSVTVPGTGVLTSLAIATNSTGGITTRGADAFFRTMTATLADNVSAYAALVSMVYPSAKGLYVSHGDANPSGNLLLVDYNSNATPVSVLTVTKASTAVANTLTATSPDITTSITTPSTTFSIANTTATTVNAFGAATTLNMLASGGTLALGGGTMTFTGATSITGGAGNMTLTSGTGASRTFTLRTTTSGGTATDAITVSATQAVSMPANIASNGSTQGTLIVTGGAGISGNMYSGGHVAAGSGSNIFFQSRSAFASAANGRFQAYNISGATLSRWTWGPEDSSTPAFILSGTDIKAGLGDGNAGGSFTASGTLNVTGTTTLSGALIATPQALSGAGAVNLTTTSTAYTSTGAAQALTLANGTNGQIKSVVHVSDGGDGVLTPTTANGYSTITFNAAGDAVTLQYFTTGGWAILGSRGVVIA